MIIAKRPNKSLWPRVSQYSGLSESFIRAHAASLSWYKICQYQQLSEEFMREFKQYLVWDTVCKFQRLSESFMREFADKLVWREICIYQNISASFIWEFRDECYPYRKHLAKIIRRKRISKTLRMIDKVPIVILDKVESYL